MKLTPPHVKGVKPRVMKKRLKMFEMLAWIVVSKDTTEKNCLAGLELWAKSGFLADFERISHLKRV